MNNEFEVKCVSCDGKGGWKELQEDGGWCACYSCNGSDFVPTSLGARVLELVRHNSKVDITAELRLSGPRLVTV